MRSSVLTATRELIGRDGRAGGRGNCRWASGVIAMGLAVHPASAQWVPNYQNYDIQRAGFFDAAHTDPAGLQTSTVSSVVTSLLDGTFIISGTSTRFLPAGGLNGQSSWSFSQATGATVQTGLVGAAFTGSMGYRVSFGVRQNSSGEIAGVSVRFTGVAVDNGQNAWWFDPAGGVTVPIGLTTPAHIGSAGYQVSAVQFLNDAGQAAGYSERITGVSTVNGQSTWVYEPSTNMTIRTGLAGAAYVGSAGYQFSETSFQNSAGSVVGLTDRITGVNSDNGQDAWVYKTSTGLSSRIGFTGAAYTGSAGFQYSRAHSQDAHGNIAGTTYLITGVNTYNGEQSWVYRPATGASTQTGLTTPAHIGSAGYQVSGSQFQCDAQKIAGSSFRIAGVAGDNGANTWVYDIASAATTQTGLTIAAYTGTSGFQFSQNDFMNAAGNVAGLSRLITGVNTFNGNSTWAWNPATGITTHTGLTAAEHTGSSGYQESLNDFQSSGGHVCGRSSRIIGLQTVNGQNTWAYNPVTGVTTQIGLTGAAYTGSLGYQFSYNTHQNQAGWVAGVSRRITGIDTENGDDTWVFNRTLGVTVPTGLSGGIYAGSAGYQLNQNVLQNASGVVVGSAGRISGVSTQIGGSAQDAWYYDPATNATIPLIGSVRLNNNFAFSEVQVLSDEGLALGIYYYFPAGMPPFEVRGFAFRPDRGFIDLGQLVAGGLSASGWDKLESSLLAGDSDRSIVGYGLVSGQTSGQSVFVMRSSGCCRADFDCSGIRNVPDVFAFLAAWFNSDPAADVDGTPGLAVSDIFTFLSFWFAGC